MATHAFLLISASLIDAIIDIHRAKRVQTGIYNVGNIASNVSHASGLASRKKKKKIRADRTQFSPYCLLLDNREQTDGRTDSVDRRTDNRQRDRRIDR